MGRAVHAGQSVTERSVLADGQGGQRAGPGIKRQRKRTKKKRSGGDSQTERGRRGRGDQRPEAAAARTGCPSALMELLLCLGSAPDYQTDRREGSWLHNPPPLGCVSVQQNPGWHGHRVTQQVHMCWQVVVLTGGAPRRSSLPPPCSPQCFQNMCLRMYIYTVEELQRLWNRDPTRDTYVQSLVSSYRKRNRLPKTKKRKTMSWLKSWGFQELLHPTANCTCSTSSM